MEGRRSHSDVDSDRVLASILDASEDAIVGVGMDGIVFAWNRAAERIYGYPAAEMIGRSLGDLMPVDSGRERQGILQAVAEGQPVDPHDTVHTAKDGQPIEVRLTVSPVTNRENRVVGASVLARDMTARRRAERALRSSDSRARAIVETAVDGIILIDQRGCIESFNAAAERQFGYRADEIFGRNVSALMPEPYTSEHDHYLERYLRTGERRIIGIGREVTARRKDGSTFSAHLSVAELAIEGETKFTGIVRDLTDRVKLEAKLREESGLARLGELAAVLAHEVKNPLAAVGGAVQILSTRLATADDREIAEEILRRLDGLNAMMGDLLLYSRPPKPRLAAVALPELVENLIAFLKLDPSWHAVTVQVEIEVPTIHADGELLKVALQNLLLNAVQAMNGRGVLQIRAHESDRVVCLDITDSGPGIPAAVQAKLFTPFFTTKARGTGLGLATVRRIAEGHDGEVSVLRSGANGTTMRFVVSQRPRVSVPD